MVAHSESRASMRPTDDQNSNSEVQEIPESRATINNFVSIAHHAQETSFKTCILS